MACKITRFSDPVLMTDTQKDYWSVQNNLKNQEAFVDRMLDNIRAERLLVGYPIHYPATTEVSDFFAIFKIWIFGPFSKFGYLAILTKFGFLSQFPKFGFLDHFSEFGFLGQFLKFRFPGHFQNLDFGPISKIWIFARISKIWIFARIFFRASSYCA